jgi:nucleoside-diphosphate-sugar epimerase
VVISESRKPVLVTGASGFVGSSVWSFFRNQGYPVRATGRRPFTELPEGLRRDSLRDDRTLDYLPFDLESLSQPTQRQKFADWIRGCDTIVHAAARSSPWGTKRQFQTANVDATQQLLDLCSEQGLPRFVFISSSSVFYREQDQLNLTEASPQADRPVNAYAASKQEAERRVQGYRGDWVILRPRAVYGRGDTVLFPRILRAAAAGRLPQLVRPGPPVCGDLILIDNLVDCIYRAVTDRRISGCYNLTDGNPVEINAFLADVLARLELPAPRRRVPVAQAYRVAWWLEKMYGWFRPQTEPPITRFGVHVFAYSKTFDISKMLRDFGPPQKSTEQGVQEFVTWMKTQRP